MKLKTRLMLLVLVVSWLPLGAVVLALSSHTETTFRASYEAQREAAASAVGGELTRTTQRIDAALAQVAKDRFLVESLVQPLNRGVFHGDQAREREVNLEARRLVRAADIQTLRLVDLGDGGKVIALGHRAGLEPPDAEVVTWAREHPGTARLRRESVETAGGAVEPVWTLQVVRVVGERIAVVAGRVLTKDWLAELLASSSGGGHVSLEAPDGQVIAATFDGANPEPASDFDHLARPVGADEPGLAAGPQVGTVRVFVDRTPLNRLVGELWLTAGALAVLSALLALFVGWWTSRRLAHPLERLVVAAGAIAAGDRDERVPEVRGRDEVADLTRAFNRMTHDLTESEERLRHAERVAAWQEIARRIAHEIKNPLFPIQMSIETLQKVHERKHPDFEEVFEESTRTILEEVERLSKIVTEFRDFARLPAPKLESIDLSALLQSVVTLHRDVAPDVNLAWDGVEGVCVVVDADQMTAVATNLIKNAIEAHGEQPSEGARVTVGLAQADDRTVSWTVTDNGPGMAAEVLDKLFTPYFTTKAAGTGLGLAITHRIVQEHGGRIRVDSVEGEGTRFEVQLPLGGG